MTLKQTPSQTVGPYFGYGLLPDVYGFSYRPIAGNRLSTPNSEGEPIQLRGQVFDGAGLPVSDAMLEIWQANAQGRYKHPADQRGDNSADSEFSGFGRCGTGPGEAATYTFDTIKPGAVSASGAPHINVIVFMRGLLNHVYTRAYFSDEPEANAIDPVLNQVELSRRSTLIARRKQGEAGIVYHFDIYMQGEKETVFFDV